MAKAKPTKLGAAGPAVLHRRTGAEALTAATAPTAAPSRRLLTAGYRVTTFRVSDAQWTWLRRQALERALTSGARVDASEIIRELLGDAMTKKPDSRR